MSKTRLLTTVATAGACLGVASFAALHLLMADAVDPLRMPVSGYAFTEPGSTLFAAGALGYAVACAALTALGFGDREAGDSRNGRADRRAPRAVGPTAASIGQVGARWLLGVTAMMFVLVVLFPTDAGKDVSSVVGQVHRYAAGVAFVLLTAVGAVAARGGRTMAVLTALSAATLLLTTVNTFAPDLADGGQWRGLPQRVLLVIEAAMIIVLACAGRRVGNETPDRSRSAARARWAFWRQARTVVPGGPSGPAWHSPIRTPIAGFSNWQLTQVPIMAGLSRATGRDKHYPQFPAEQVGKISADTARAMERMNPKPVHIEIAALRTPPGTAEFRRLPRGEPRRRGREG